MDFFNKAPSQENEPQIKGPFDMMLKQIEAVQEGGGLRKTRLAVGLALMTFLSTVADTVEAADQNPIEGGIKVEQADPKRGGAPVITGTGLDRKVIVAPREGAPEPEPKVNWNDPSDPENVEALKRLQKLLGK